MSRRPSRIRSKRTAEKWLSPRTIPMFTIARIVTAPNGCDFYTSGLNRLPHYPIVLNVSAFRCCAYTYWNLKFKYNLALTLRPLNLVWTKIDKFCFFLEFYRKNIFTIKTVFSFYEWSQLNVKPNWTSNWTQIWRFRLIYGYYKARGMKKTKYCVWCLGMPPKSRKNVNTIYLKRFY